MIKDTEEIASEDEELWLKVASPNQLDSLVFQLEKDSSEGGEKVSEDS
jgi:hypothetical protein